MSYAPSLRAVRAHFGLHQHELAVWLGLSRQQLKLVEAAIDPLPAHAKPWVWPWLTALDHGVSDAAVNPSAVSPSVVGPSAGPVEEAPAGPDRLVARLLECQYRAARLDRLLATQQAAIGYARRRLAAGPLLQAALPPADAVDSAAAPATSIAATRLAVRRRWLSRLLEEATDSLHPSHPTSGPTTAALLTARRNAWLHEAAELAAYLAQVAAG